MKVLILSAEVWRNDNNGGNVLSNMFAGSCHEFAQIYCNPGTPKNNICSKYFQMTDAMCIRNFLRHDPIGNSFEIDLNILNETEMSADLRKPVGYNFIHKLNLGIFHFFRSILWNNSQWESDKLCRFITEFAPDIIFAPCYGNKFMLRLTRFVAKLTQKPLISYISDDSYTLKQFNLDPFYWFLRFQVRHELHKTFPFYSLVYTMTEAQKHQCEKDFNANMKLLRKCAPYELNDGPKEIRTPIRLVYAGGIYLNRWKTLSRIVGALKKLNKRDVRAVLDIYTGCQLSFRQKYALNDKKNSFVHNSVSQEELLKVYHSSDIALHLESFDLKNRLTTRMSFSTKIVDCLASGCAVMAICDAKQGGFIYLRQENAAICIDKVKNIYPVLSDICNNPEKITEYRRRAFECCKTKHDPVQIRAGIHRDFEEIAKTK